MANAQLGTTSGQHRTWKKLTVTACSYINFIGALTGLFLRIDAYLVDTYSLEIMFYADQARERKTKRGRAKSRECEEVITEIGLRAERKISRLRSTHVPDLVLC